DNGFIRRGLYPHIGVVRKQFPCVMVITQRRMQNAKHLTLNALVENGEYDFHAIVEITPHQVGAAQIQAILWRRILEIKDAAVLKVTPHHTANANIFTETGQTGTQTANATNQQIDLYIRL